MTDSYIGGTLLFDEDVQKISIPCPKFVEGVTLWISIVGNSTRCASIYANTLIFGQTTHAQHMRFEERRQSLTDRPRLHLS